MPALTYVIISPVKNEEPYLRKTLESVIGQTIQPQAWIIVDDGSTDGTRAILQDYSQRVKWIRVVNIPGGTPRRPGAGVIHAFKAGHKLVVCDTTFDLIVKLDADLDLPADYFERLIARFEADDRLGIASGVYLERNSKNGWEEVKLPPYHAAGASKVVRVKCFNDIGGFVASRGWDTLDEIRAQILGWRTCHFKELKFRHLKAEGSGTGYARTCAMQGEIYYLTGGGLLFFCFKLLHRLFAAKPFLLNGLMLLAGFLRASFSGRTRLVTDAEARFYRSLLNGRVRSKLIDGISAARHTQARVET